MKKQEIQKIVNEQRDWLSKGRSVNKSFRIKALRRLYKAIVKYRAYIHLALAKDLGIRNEEFCFDETDEALYLIKDAILQLELSPVINEPKGVALIMTPWFSPFISVMEAVIKEISGGNTVVIKPSSHSINTAEVLDKVFKKAFPPCFASVILGSRSANRSLTNIRFDKIDFCGNKEVAKAIFDKAIDTSTPIELDVCDVNSYIIKAKDNLKKQAFYLADNKFAVCGQTKDAIDIVLVDEEVAEEFADNLIFATEAFVESDPLVNDDYGKMKDEAAYKRIVKILDEAVLSEKVIYGGAKCEKTLQVGPVIIREDFANIKDLKEKVLGPVLYVVSLPTSEIVEIERNQYLG